MRIAHVVLIAGLCSGCAYQRAHIAGEAQNQMIGLTKEQVLACMGPPLNRASEGATEVWSYNSTNGYTAVASNGGRGWATATASQRFCTVNVTMTDGRVSRLNYLGPTGGMLTQGEQCAFAVQNCVQQQ